MWLYLRLGFRNLLRNKRRSIIAGTAIGIGLAALIFVDALMLGMQVSLIHSATQAFLGDGQIHQADFRSSPEVEKTIHQPREVLGALKEDPNVVAVSERTLSFAMISSPANLSAVTLVGIDPNNEQHLSQIDDTIQEGEYFTGADPRDLVLGSKLAEILEVSLGSRVVVTVAQADSGDLSQEMFRVSGIYHFNVPEMDRAMVFVRLEKAQEILALEGRIHEIALKLSDSSLGGRPSDPFWQQFSTNGNQAESWAVLLPQLKMASEVSSFSILIVGIILFGVVALGIVNTLFMSLHERMFEFGVLRAVGTRPFRMATLILVEAGALAALSNIMGVLLGLVVTGLTAKYGIDYTGIEALGVTIRELLYPVPELRQFIVYPFVVFFFTLLIGIYPAWHAAKMQPAEAMRRSF